MPLVPPTLAFVCTANMCRSPMAHAIGAAEIARRGWIIEVPSAGIHDFQGAMAAREARLTCEAYGTPMPKLLSTWFRALDPASLVHVLVMEHAHAEALRKQQFLPVERVRLLGEFDPRQRGFEIQDPIGQDMAAFALCYERLRDCIVGFLDATPELGKR